MGRESSAVDAARKPGDFIDEQFKRLKLQSEEAGRFAELTQQVERNRAELSVLQSELQQIGQRWRRADATLTEVKIGSHASA